MGFLCGLQVLMFLCLFKNDLLGLLLLSMPFSKITPLEPLSVLAGPLTDILYDPVILIVLQILFLKP